MDPNRHNKGHMIWNDTCNSPENVANAINMGEKASISHVGPAKLLANLSSN